MFASLLCWASENQLNIVGCEFLIDSNLSKKKETYIPGYFVVYELYWFLYNRCCREVISSFARTFSVFILEMKKVTDVYM